MSYFLLITASLFYTGMNICVKLIGASIPVVEVLFFRFFICLIFISLLIAHNSKKHLKTDRIALHITRAIFGFLALFFIFKSLQFLPMLNTILLANIAPIILPLILLLLYKQKIDYIFCLFAFTAFIGIALILHPNIKGVNAMACLPLAASLCIALAKVSIKSLTKTDNLITVLFYYFFFSSLISLLLLLLLLLLYHNWSTPTLSQAILLLGVGLLGLGFQSLATICAYMMKIEMLSLFLYTNIVLSFIVDCFIWHYSLSMQSAFGVILVIVSLFACKNKNRKNYES